MTDRYSPDDDDTFDPKAALVSPTPKYVRIRVREAGDGEISSAAGTATVIDGCITVTPEDAPRWLATIDGLSVEEE